jgi:uncharacterized protein (TIGR00251 family)
MLAAVRGHDGAVQILVRAQPGAKRSVLVGLHGDRLKVAIHAPPVDGKANDALLAFFADLLDLPKRAVTLGAGQTSRDKRVDVDANLAAVDARITAALAKSIAKTQ